MDMTNTEDLEAISEFADSVSPYLDWFGDHWFPLVLSGEIIGAVVAIKVGRYRRGLLWLAGALLTIWIGAVR